MLRQTIQKILFITKVIGRLFLIYYWNINITFSCFTDPNEITSFNYIKSPTPSTPSYAPPLPPKPKVSEPEPTSKSVSVPPLPPKIRNERQFESKETITSDQFVPKLPPKIKLDQQDETHSSPGKKFFLLILATRSTKRYIGCLH